MLLLLFTANTNAAEGGFYMSGNLGYSMVNDSDLGTFTEAELEDIIEEDLPAGSSGSLELSYDPGFTVGAAAGYDFGSVRLEGELSYQQNDFDEITATITIPGEGSGSGGIGVDGDVTNLLILCNGYYDFRKGSALRPYITAGIGYAFIDIEDESDSVFAYQVGLGLSYAMNDNITWDLKYRYLGTSDLEVAGVGDVEYSAHSLNLGLRFNF